MHIINIHIHEAIINSKIVCAKPYYIKIFPTVFYLYISVPEPYFCGVRQLYIYTYCVVNCVYTVVFRHRTKVWVRDVKREHCRVILYYTKVLYHTFQMYCHQYIAISCSVFFSNLCWPRVQRLVKGRIVISQPNMILILQYNL